MPGRTSCARSLSPTSRSRSRCRRPPPACASVPITSSASTPSTISSGQPCARTTLVQRLDLPDEILRHRRTVRLVVRIPVVAERLARGVEDDGEVVGLLVFGYPAQHGHHAAQRPGGLAARRAQVGQRVKCAIQVRRPIHQNERRHVSDHQDPGAHRSAGDVHHQRAGGLAGAGDYGRVRRGDRTAARRAARGFDVRQRAHQAGPSVLRQGRAHRAAAVRRRLRRDLRRRSRTHGSRESRRVRGQVAGDRPQHPAAAREGRQRVPGRRLRLPLLLRAQDDVRALRVRLRRAARRLRHARRAVRVPHAGADRQEPAHSDHPRRRRLLARPRRLDARQARRRRHGRTRTTST